MLKHKTLNIFAARPRSSLVLAVMLVLLGVLAVSGIVPASNSRTYFAGHEWVLAGACWLMAIFFAACSVMGQRP